MKIVTRLKLVGGLGLLGWSLFAAGCGGDVQTEGAGGAGGGGTASSGGGGGDGGGGSGEALLYPFEVGYTWTYDVLPVLYGGLCKSGTHSTKILSEQDIDGRPAFEVSSFCTSIPKPYFLAHGAAPGEYDHVYRSKPPTWVLYFDPTLKDGYAWTGTNGENFTWHKEASVTVPAGTFEDCWTARQNDVEVDAFTTYCRGVGPVRVYEAGGIAAGNGYDAVLTGASFLDP